MKRLRWPATLLHFLLPTLLPGVLAAKEAETPPPASTGPCSAAEFRQFDFWVGEWDVTSGWQPAGTNSIRRVHGGCVLQETWQGAGEGGISGGSYVISKAVSKTGSAPSGEEAKKKSAEAARTTRWTSIITPCWPTTASIPRRAIRNFISRWLMPSR